MSRRAVRISNWQLSLLVFAASLGTGPFTFGRTLIADLGRQAWMAVVPALVLGVGGVGLAAAIGRRLPGRSLDRSLVVILSPYATYPYLLALALLLTADAAINLHVFAAVSSVAMLQHVPLAYLALLTATGGALAAYFGPEIVGRCAEAVVPLALSTLVVALLAVLANSHWGWLRPVAAPVPSAGVWRLVLMAGGTPGFLPALLLAPMTRTPARAAPLAAAVGAAGLILAASLALPVAVFGMPFATDLHYPFLTAAATVAWEWLPIHRIVDLQLLVWQLLTFVSVSICLWGGAWLIKRTFRRLPWAGLVAGLAAICAAAAALTYPGADQQRFLDAFSVAAVVLGVAGPALLLAAAGRRSSRQGAAR